MNRKLSLLPLTLLLPACASTEQAAQAAPVLASAASPMAVEVVEASARANVHNKRVLVVLNKEGEDLAKNFKSDRAVSRKLLYEVETVSLPATAGSHWNWQEDASGAVLLACSGKELARFGADELASDAVIGKLQPHFCEPADANQKLGDAMAEAKKTGRNILIRFDAPW